MLNIIKPLGKKWIKVLYNWRKNIHRFFGKKLGSCLKQVILYGSQARGDAWEGSDFDMLVVVEKRDNTVHEKSIDAAVEMLDKYDKLFSSIIYNEEEWQHAQEFPFGWNIKHEGIVV